MDEALERLLALLGPAPDDNPPTNSIAREPVPNAGCSPSFVQTLRGFQFPRGEPSMASRFGTWGTDVQSDMENSWPRIAELAAADEARRLFNNLESMRRRSSGNFT